MKTNTLFANLLFTFLLINLTFLVPNKANAQSDTSIVIQPSSVEVTASPDQKLARSFSIINRSNFYVRLKLVVKDYKQISSDGKIEFYQATSEPANSWLVPEFLEIGLNPLETKNIGFVVNVPKNLSGGGHYGAILFQPIGNSATTITTNNFGELVLLTVNGTMFKTSAVAKVVNFSTTGIQKGNPVDFNFEMKNTGNTQFNTQGKLVLKDLFGKDVGSFNIGQLTVYPNTNRVFKWRWNGTPSFGILRAGVMLSDGSANQNLKLINSIWFVIFPWQITLTILLIVLAISAVILYRSKIYKYLESIYKKYKHVNKIKIRSLAKDKNNFISP